MVNLGFWVDFVLKTAKMKLPLHDLLIVKATAPAAATVLLYIFPYFPLRTLFLSISNNKSLTTQLFCHNPGGGILHIPFCHAYVFHHVLIFSHSDMRIILSSPLQETVALHTRSASVFSLPADPGYESQKAGTVYKDAADFQKALL